MNKWDIVLKLWPVLAFLIVQTIGIGIYIGSLNEKWSRVAILSSDIRSIKDTVNGLKSNYRVNENNIVSVKDAVFDMRSRVLDLEARSNNLSNKVQSSCSAKIDEYDSVIKERMKAQSSEIKLWVEANFSEK